MSSESQAVAPPVVAVIVSCDPGSWFEETLKALGTQDYPNLSVLVIDAGSSEDVTPRVGAVLPTAFVRRLGANPGFAAAANEVLAVVEGASHFVLCHDDVAPAPDAVRLLVEEAFRSNAGVVAPKLVDWDDPDRLLEVGAGADKSGAPVHLVERGELDQEQHDAVVDVFVAPGGFTLVRADLFAAIGGFDRAMHLYGEDLDLSWRAQMAGARVVVAPAARVRHLEAMSSGRRGVPPGERRELAGLRREVRPLQLRHRLRAVLKNYSRFHLVRVLPQIVLLHLAEILFGVLSGRADTAADTVRAWRWNLGRRRELRAARRDVRRYRRLPDREVRRLQAGGSARLNAFVRGQLAAEGRLRRGRVAPARTAPLHDLRLTAAVVAGAAVVLLVGSRDLLGERLPAVNELADFPGGPGELWRLFLSGWRTVGLGAEAPAPAGLGVLAVAGTLLLGAMGVLQKLLVLGTLPLGALGAYRLVRPLGSQRVRLAALATYLAVPLPYNALAHGRWSALLTYAAVPWVLARLLRATGIEPFGHPDRRRQAWRREVLPLGVLLALWASFVPSSVLLVLLAALALLVGSLVAGGAAGAARGMAATLGALVLAAVLLFPWSLEFLLPGSTAAALTGVGDGRAAGLGRLLRFQTGPLGGGALGWAFAVAGALPLLIARGWRLAWAGRLWFLTLACAGAAWASARGWLPLPLPPSDVLLVPAALGLSVCVALGLAAFEVDLPGYRFGWRQLASLVASVAVVLGVLPVLLAATGGRWGMPRRDFAGLLSWMPEQVQAGSFRVLWLGHPAALPLAGWELAPGIAYGTSRDGPPQLSERWPTASPGSSALLADAVRIARQGDTTRLGHLLAPMAVRYLVVPTRAAPATEDAPVLPVPADLVAALEAQVDLKGLESDESLRVFENVAWLPARALLEGPATEASRRGRLSAAARAELAGAAPVLPERRSHVRYEGELPAGGEVYLAESRSERWELTAGGRRAGARSAFGWATAFGPAQAGPATLRYRTSPLRWGAVALEGLAWLVAVRALVVRRRSEP